LQLIEQRLMARDNLLALISEFDIYADLAELRSSEKVNLLRESVRIKGVAAAREGYSDDGTISVLTISAKMDSPEQAQQVAHELARQTIELSANTRIAQARETLDFFVLQEEKLSARVAVLTSRITAFRNKYEVSVPGGVEFRRSEIATINAAILEIARQSITLQREIDAVDRTTRQATAARIVADLQSQIDNLDAQRTMLAGRKIELAESIETTPEIQRELGTFERQLEQLQSQLIETSLRRTEADIGFRLESQRQSERLTVLEPALLPDFPVTSSRKRIALLGAAISIGSAFVLALLMEIRNPVIRSAAQMQRELGFAPVVSIPVLEVSTKRPGIFQRVRMRFSRRKSKLTDISQTGS